MQRSKRPAGASAADLLTVLANHQPQSRQQSSEIPEGAPVTSAAAVSASSDAGASSGSSATVGLFACEVCRVAKRCCDEQRPCHRCSRLGLQW